MFSQIRLNIYDRFAGVQIQTCVSASDSFDAVIRLSGSTVEEKNPSDHVLVLNFANSLHPGGGVKRGARTQEEELCRKSTLYCSLTGKGAEVMYQYNASLKHYLASDYMCFPLMWKLFATQKENCYRRLVWSQS